MTDPGPPPVPARTGPTELQIVEIRSVDEHGAVCVVRCLAGVARAGQAYEDGRLVLEWMDQYGRPVDGVDPPHSAKVGFSGRGPLRERTVLSTDGPRRFGYLGPREIWHAAEGVPVGQVVRGADDFRAWAAAREPAEWAEPFTYVVDEDGFLRLAARRSEHVACAGRGSVRAAGEVSFRWDGDRRHDGRRDGGRWEVVEVTNQSTGYCPDPDCWPSVAAALDRAGIARPARFTQEFVFRHCTGCTELNIVRENHFVCVFCGADLPGGATHQ
ncbi:hypothetical protein [Streptomyces sp. NPDC003023]|uniref:hypothetical protein n=1 Tax=Streptomyces sp. NPDC003023 TaxID=3364675 RepID=UPI0036BD15AD